MSLDILVIVKMIDLDLDCSIVGSVFKKINFDTYCFVTVTVSVNDRGVKLRCHQNDRNLLG